MNTTTLRQLVAIDSTVLTTLNHSDKTTLWFSISVADRNLNREITNLGIGEWDTERQCVKVNRLRGVDMGFSLTHALGQMLYGDGFAVKHCNETFHANDRQL